MKSYIVDVFSRVYYGPYNLEKDKKKLEEHIKLVKYIADACVEVGTNVLIVSQNKLLQEYSHYKHGSTYDVKKKVKELTNPHVKK